MRSIQYTLIVVWQAVLLCVMLAVGSNIIGIPLETGPAPHPSGVQDERSRPGINELRDHLER